jgi:hypothetical protein
MNWSLVDSFRSAAVQAAYMVHALRVGDPRRVAHGLVMEGIYVSVIEPTKREKIAEITNYAARLAKDMNDVYAITGVDQMYSTACFQWGEWANCLRHSDASADGFRRNCRGRMWEIAQANVFGLASLFYLGELQEMSNRLSGILAEADERNDWFSRVSFRIGYASHAWLAQDDAERVHREAEYALGHWPRKDFDEVRLYALMSVNAADLYSGDAGTAWQRNREAWSVLKRSLHMRLSTLRVKIRHMNASTALAVIPHQSADAKSLLALARNEAEALAREGVAWPKGLAWLIFAGIAASEGKDADATEMLDRAIAALDAHEMALYAAAARYRKGQLSPGESGREMLNATIAWMEAHGVKRPDRMVDLLVPGFARFAHSCADSSQSQSG